MERWILVARWAGHRDSDFYPWLRSQSGTPPESWEHLELYPKPSAAQIEASVQKFQEQLLGRDEPALCVAHSAACQVVLRTLDRVPRGRIRAALLVAPWFDLDEPWDSIRAWTTTPFDGIAARAAGVPIRALLSDNDPFTADHERTRKKLEERVAASVRVIPGAGHFNRSEEPEVLAELQDLLESLR